MDTARSLLFGILARDAGLIDGRTLISILHRWNADRSRPLADVLVERGGIGPSGWDQLAGRLEDLMRDGPGDIPGTLSSMLERLERFVAADEEADVRDAIRMVLSAATRTMASADGPEDVDARSDLPYVTKERLPGGLRYTRTRWHASGGMGSVWLAHDASIGRDVALKELRSETASLHGRFLREARITGQLEHPGIVPVYEIGRDPFTGQPFYTMRFVRGRTLLEASRTFHARRQEGLDEPLDFVNLLSAFVSVCHTIAYAHSHDIVHLDLKGENVILGDFGEVIVLDWGLARRLARPDDTDTTPAPIVDELGRYSADQTVMGQVMGTPAYMAPEQARGRLERVSPRTDIFGAGAILYEILAGRPPFAGTGVFDVLHQAQQGTIRAPDTWWPDVPRDLEAICLKALAREPTDRYATATELAQEVQGWQDKQRRRAEDDLRQTGARLMQQQAALVKLTQSEVFSAPSLFEVLQRMIEVAARTLGVERVGVWRFTADRRTIRCGLLYELGTGRTLSDVADLRAEDFPRYFAALETSEVVPAHNACEDPSTRELAGSYLVPLGIGAMMDAPIHVAGELEGIVCHEHVGPLRTWMPDEQLFAIAIANLVAQAISQWDDR